MKGPYRHHLCAQCLRACCVFRRQTYLSAPTHGEPCFRLTSNLLAAMANTLVAISFWTLASPIILLRTSVGIDSRIVGRLCVVEHEISRRARARPHPTQQSISFVLRLNSHVRFARICSTSAPWATLGVARTIFPIASRETSSFSTSSYPALHPSTISTDRCYEDVSTKAAASIQKS